VFRQGTKSLLIRALMLIMSRKAVGRGNTASPRRGGRQYGMPSVPPVKHLRGGNGFIDVLVAYPKLCIVLWLCGQPHRSLRNFGGYTHPFMYDSNLSLGSESPDARAVQFYWRLPTRDSGHDRVLFRCRCCIWSSCGC
jgi:hypothetical protein